MPELRRPYIIIELLQDNHCISLRHDPGFSFRFQKPNPDRELGLLASAGFEFRIKLRT